MPHEWTTKGRATEAASTLCSIAKENEGQGPHGLLSAYADMLETARPAITASFFEYIHQDCPDLMRWFVSDERHAAKNEKAVNAAEDMQRQITELQDTVTWLQRDVNTLKGKLECRRSTHGRID